MYVLRHNVSNLNIFILSLSQKSNSALPREFEALKEDKLMLRKRHDRRVRKCNGCKGSIEDMPLVPPTDICLLRKEKFPKLGKKRSSKNPDNFVLTKVHYHPSRKCLKFDRKKL